MQMPHVIFWISFEPWHRRTCYTLAEIDNLWSLSTTPAALPPPLTIATTPLTILSTHLILNPTMPCSHLSYTAMTGKPVVGDPVLRCIVSGASLTRFAGMGAFKEHHLRVLVTMPRTPISVIKMVAGEPETNPARAIDYCSSATIARALIKICGDVTCFSLYEQQSFVNGARIHDFRTGADRFRRREVVFEVLCERILFGGDVLPPHISAWFNSYGRYCQESYIERYGSAHMMACYQIYEKQLFEVTEDLVTPPPYQFMIAYHRYTKYLPLTMFFNAVLKEKASVEAIVKDRVAEGFTMEQVRASLVADGSKNMLDLNQSAKGKNKRRRFARVAKSDSVRDLWALCQRVFALSSCERLILSFL